MLIFISELFLGGYEKINAPGIAYLGKLALILTFSLALLLLYIQFHVHIFFILPRGGLRWSPGYSIEN